MAEPNQGRRYSVCQSESVAKCRIHVYMRNDFVASCLLFLFPFAMGAQDTVDSTSTDWDWRKVSVTLTHQVGTILPVEPFLRGENALGSPLKRFSATSFHFFLRTSGIREWERRYGRPEAGFGITILNLYNPRELGSPLAVHRSFTAPFCDLPGFRLDYGADIGFAAGWRRYDAGSNPYNELISTQLTAFFRLRLGLMLLLSDHFSLSLNGGLTHVSNGNVKRPNAGLNVAAAGVGLCYRMEERKSISPVEPLTHFDPYTELSLSVFGGVEKQLYQTHNLSPGEKYRGLSHGIGGVSLSLNRRLAYKSMAGVGLSLLYHRGDNMAVSWEDGRLHGRARTLAKAHLRLGIFPGYELVFNRWSVLLQAEYYLLAPGNMDAVDRFRQRLGLKYRLTDRLYLATLVNARQFSIADFVEWHVGYTFRKNPPPTIPD